MKKLFAFLSEKVIPIGTLFLIFFIPVYPKIPIVDIFGTWVYIRLEDFLIALLIGLFLITRIYERKLSNAPLTFPILFYWAIGALSVIWSLLFIGPKIANYFPHLAVLHFVRRIEYMMLFFIAYESLVKKKERLVWVIGSLALAVICIVIYGVGQKFAGFPAFLTMNEEFAKGVPLRLPPTARIVSTFGGHYDLAAYLVFTIPIFGSLIFGLRKAWQKLFFFILTLSSVVLLLFTASRVSFGMYLVSISTMLFLQKKKILILPVVVVSFILLNFVSGAAERFYKTFRFSDVVVDLSTGKPIGTLEKLEGGSAVIQEIESPAEENLPRGSDYISVPPATSKDPSEEIQTVKLVVSHELATGSGEVATISGSFLIQKALVYDISITTRFQGQWPKAVAAFKRNIFLGSGYSTLSVAVDGNYHRMLGETGILGAVAFLGILAYAFFVFAQRRNDLPALDRAFVIGVFAGIVGLLLNAVLIDVFEASKVAYTLWLLVGVALAILSGPKLKKRYIPFLISLFISNIAVALYLVFSVFYLYGAVLSGYFVGDDFTWLRWAAESSFSDIAKYFTESSGFFYRPISKILYFVLYSVFWLKQGAYHVVTLLIYAGICLLVYSILRQYTKRILAFVGAIVFAGLSVHHENLFWISGYTSIISTLFLLLALRLRFAYSSISIFWQRTVLIICAVLSLLLSMFSYDSLVIAPIIFVIVSVLLLRSKEKGVYATLLFIPLYWIIRSLANAVGPEGDYGFRLTTLPVNSIANATGYVFATFVGPSAVEYAQVLRASLRDSLHFVTLGLIIVVMIGVSVLQALRDRAKIYRVSIIWFICFLIAIIPFAGLGGMAERYALLPSAFLIIALITGLDIWIHRGNLWKRSIVVSTLLVCILYWNTHALTQVTRHWQFAHKVSEQTLLRVKTEFFPLREDKTFIFVDVPIRYGRAWIYPTGLPDALWHIFREAPHRVIITSTTEEAFAIKTGDSVPVVLRFDNYELKWVVTEIRPVEGSNEN